VTATERAIARAHTRVVDAMAEHDAAIVELERVITAACPTPAQHNYPWTTATKWLQPCPHCGRDAWGVKR
jgi:formylmethanofuran:tetrahydromethanopterin formyltransferase